MSRKELPIRLRVYPHANDNRGHQSPDPRLLSLARLIARAAVRDLLEETANDNVTVAGRHSVKGTEQGAAATLIAEQDELDPLSPPTAKPFSTPEPNQGDLPLEADAQSTRAPSLCDLPAGTQFDLFPDTPDSENRHDS